MKSKPQKPKPPEPVAPASAGEWFAAIEDLRGFAPPGFEDATLLVAYVDLPGDNTQRTQHWAVKSRWQEKVRAHFRRSLEVQNHPGIIEHPRVHVQMFVKGKGDPRNMAGRAKFLVDRLQRYREIPYVKGGKAGVRRFGDLDLIEDDRVLTDENCTFEEIVSRLNGGVNERKVLIWVKPS